MAAGDWKELFSAAESGDLDLVKYHIRNEIDPNYQHPEVMTTPLIVSIENEHFEVAEFLLQNGADPSIKEIFGNQTALSMAKKTQDSIDFTPARPY